MREPGWLLSLVIPAYGVEDYLPRCLDSVLVDPACRVEVVVVDDCSPDKSGYLADQYAERDGRVRVLHLPANGGLSRARNAGLEHARGEYLWFVDGDDWLPEGALPAVTDRLIAHRPDVLVVDHEEVFPDGSRLAGTPAGVLAEVATPGPLARWPELLRLPHSACTKVVRRDFLDRIGLRFDSGWYEDVAFSHRALLAADRIDALDQVCYAYRQREGEAITKSTSPRHFEVFGQYERVWEAVDRADGRYDGFRPALFQLMISHLLVIAGHEHRVPAALRREFFGRTVAEYRRRVPPGGYPVPGGLAGIKHRLVRHGGYRWWAVLRWCWRTFRPQADRHERVSRPTRKPAAPAV